MNVRSRDSCDCVGCQKAKPPLNRENRSGISPKLPSMFFKRRPGRNQLRVRQFNAILVHLAGSDLLGRRVGASSGWQQDGLSLADYRSADNRCGLARPDFSRLHRCLIGLRFDSVLRSRQLIDPVPARTASSRDAQSFRCRQDKFTFRVWWWPAMIFCPPDRAPH